MLTMRPRPLFRSCGSASRVSRSVDISVSSQACRQPVVVEVLEAAGGRPAGVVDDDVELSERLERAIDEPRAAQPGSAESPATASARAPLPSASISATASSSSSCRRANRVTLQPSRASEIATARPMPDDEPATIATQPFSSRIHASPPS